MQDDAPSPGRLIIDTDLDTDCDDVGALALVHALATDPQVDLQAVVCSAPVLWGGPCALLLNEAAGRSHLPVGVNKRPNEQPVSRFAAYMAHRRRAAEQMPDGRLYNETLGRERFGDTPPRLPSGVKLYRRILAEDMCRQTVICAIGTLSVLAAFLESGPDDIADLSGTELAKCSVRHLVTMGLGTVPRGRDRFNWAMDLPAAATVLNQWPTALTVSPAGEHVQTGAHFTRALPPTNPYRRAYEIHRGGAGRSRSSWDQIAVLYASGMRPDLFTVSSPGTLTFDEASGRHEWRNERPDWPRQSVRPACSDADLADVLEALMIEGALTNPV